MSGSRYVFDTNAIVTLLQGNAQLIQLTQDADWIGISVISQIEFLVFPGLTESDCQLFQAFLQRVEILGLIATDGALIHRIIEIRQQYRLKLPDAVIATVAFHHSASLVTADQEFSKVNSLGVVHW